MISEEWEIECTDEWVAWWGALDADEQESVAFVVTLLEQQGPGLSRPYSAPVKSSRHPHMRELRIQHRGRPCRTLYAFDPRRCAILLIGGDKTGKDRWYKEFVPRADRLYGEHLEILEQEGLI